MEKSVGTAIDPRFNPSYPQRTHSGERAHWESVLQLWTSDVCPVKWVVFTTKTSIGSTKRFTLSKESFKNSALLD